MPDLEPMQAPSVTAPHLVKSKFIFMDLEPKRTGSSSSMLTISMDS